jgi:hypothetical protein
LPETETTPSPTRFERSRCGDYIASTCAIRREVSQAFLELRYRCIRVRSPIGKQKQYPNGRSQSLEQSLEAASPVKHTRSARLKTRRAHFPYNKGVDQFDFAFQPSVDERELAWLAFLERKENDLSWVNIPILRCAIVKVLACSTEIRRPFGPTASKDNSVMLSISRYFAYRCPDSL